LINMLSDMLYGRAFLISTVSNTARASIIKRGVAVSKVILLTNGFDVDDVVTSSPFVRKANQVIAAYVGTLGLTSGVETILEAAAILRDWPELQFVIAGDGTERERLEEIAKRERLTHVTFLGHRSGAEAKALQRQADMALVPLRAAVLDALPKKMFDSLALGTPVVASANGEAAALIRESGGGIVVAPEDAVAFAAAIRTLGQDRVHRERLGAAGQMFVQARYDRLSLVRAYAQRLAEAL
jgi:colanic acid biosynthesis glycosyl transferase WcaI